MGIIDFAMRNGRLLSFILVTAILSVIIYLKIVGPLTSDVPADFQNAKILLPAMKAFASIFIALLLVRLVTEAWRRLCE